MQQNGRITFMFCAFDGKPNICRLYGAGTVVRPGDNEWDALRALFTSDGAVRSIVVADISRTSNSCGYSVPFMDYQEERTRLIDWAENETDDDLEQYWATKNASSIDGIPAIRA